MTLPLASFDIKLSSYSHYSEIHFNWLENFNHALYTVKSLIVLEFYFLNNWFSYKICESLVFVSGLIICFKHCYIISQFCVFKHYHNSVYHKLHKFNIYIIILNSSFYHLKHQVLLSDIQGKIFRRPMQILSET